MREYSWDKKMNHPPIESCNCATKRLLSLGKLILTKAFFLSWKKEILTILLLTDGMTLSLMTMMYFLTVKSPSLWWDPCVEMMAWLKHEKQRKSFNSFGCNTSKHGTIQKPLGSTNFSHRLHQLLTHNLPHQGHRSQTPYSGGRRYFDVEFSAIIQAPSSAHKNQQSQWSSQKLHGCCGFFGKGTFVGSNWKRNQGNGTTWTMGKGGAHRKITVGTVWVFWKKKDAVGNVVEYKAWLCAQGFTQVFLKDCKKTFAPTGWLNSLKALIAHAVANKLDFHQMDVKSAFLNTALEENVHISCPKGVKLKQGLFLPLNKALYGLKQAPLAWYNWFLSWSQKCG